MTSRRQENVEVARLARKAADLGKDDAVALSFGGFAIGYVAGELVEGAALVDRAIALNPNLAAAWCASGLLKTRLGDPDLIFTPTGMTRPGHWLKRLSASSRITCAHCASQRRATPVLGVWKKHGVSLHARFSSIPKCASPTSGTGSDGIRRRISLNYSGRFERRDCRSDRH